MSESSSVLRAACEQLLAEAGGRYSNQGQTVTLDVRPLLRAVEAFARRQRQEALREAADEPTPPDLSAELREWTATALNVFLAPDGLVATPETIEHWAQIVDAHTHALIAARADAEGTGGGE